MNAQRRLLRLSCTLLLLTALPAAAALLAHHPVSAVVTEYGRYRLQGEAHRRSAPNSTAGFDSVIDAELVATDDQIPLRLGEVFGLRFALSALNADTDWLPVDVHIAHPPIVDHRGEVSRGFTMRSAAQRGEDGRYHHAAYYILSQPGELAAGAWRIDVLYRGERVLTRSFLLQ